MEYKMRVIKFRGMSINGSWSYGLPCIITKGQDIIGSYISNSCGVPMAFNIRPETLTEFTGLYDCTKFKDLTTQEQKDWLQSNKQEDWKGKEIFEGDVISHGQDLYGESGIVFYDNDRCMFQLKMIKSNRIEFLDEHNMFRDKKILRKIIGNIYQNPELLKD